MQIYPHLRDLDNDYRRDFLINERAILQPASSARFLICHMEKFDAKDCTSMTF